MRPAVESALQVNPHATIFNEFFTTFGGIFPDVKFSLQETTVKPMAPVKVEGLAAVGGSFLYTFGLKIYHGSRRVMMSISYVWDLAKPGTISLEDLTYDVSFLGENWDYKDEGTPAWALAFLYKELEGKDLPQKIWGKDRG